MSSSRPDISELQGDPADKTCRSVSTVYILPTVIVSGGSKGILEFD